MGRGARLVAEQDRGDGFGCGELLSWQQGGEIADLIVIPSHRNRGIGQALINGLLDRARNLGMAAVEIGVQADNERARALYERLGFSYRRTVVCSVEGRPSSLIYLSREP